MEAPTKAAAAMAGDANVGRAEAMCWAMQAMIEMGSLDEVHPSHWAAFVVVGEGPTRSLLQGRPHGKVGHER